MRNDLESIILDLSYDELVEAVRLINKIIISKNDGEEYKHRDPSQSLSTRRMNAKQNEKEIIKEVEAGNSMKEIAIKYNTSFAYVRRIKEEKNIIKPRKKENE